MGNLSFNSSCANNTYVNAHIRKTKGCLYFTIILKLRLNNRNFCEAGSYRRWDVVCPKTVGRIL